MWTFFNQRQRNNRKYIREQFKRTQRESLKKMFNPSLWTKIKFNFWRLYWNLFIPEYIHIYRGGFSTHCIDEKNKTSMSLEGLTKKEKRKALKYFIKQSKLNR